MIKRMMGLLMLVGLLSNCATIVSGKSQQMSFSSTPDGATVSVDGKTIGKTPMTVALERKRDQTLFFDKEGYGQRSMPMATTLNNWFWGNILIGGLLGSTTDGVSGAITEYSPNNYHITLNPIDNISGTAIKENPMYRLVKDDARYQAKMFIMSGYSDIIRELNGAKGEYLNSLVAVLKIEKSNTEEALKKIKSFSNIYTNIPEFSDKVVEYFMGK